MLVRSSRRERARLAAFALAGAAACGGGKAPEADPATAGELAARMLANMPAPSSTPTCADAELRGGLTMTHRALHALAGRPVPADATSAPTLAEWTNPAALDAPAVRTLLDPAADSAAKRRAAGALAHAKFYVVYRVDSVNAPIALQVKHLVIGTLHARAIRFDAKSGRATCVTIADFQNDKEKSDWAIAQSDKSMIDPAVAKAMRDDLSEQWVKNAPGFGAPNK